MLRDLPPGSCRKMSGMIWLIIRGNILRALEITCLNVYKVKQAGKGQKWIQSSWLSSNTKKMHTEGGSRVGYQGGVQRHCLHIQKLSQENQRLVALETSKECEGWWDRSFLIFAARESLRRMWPYWSVGHAELVINDREKTEALCLFATKLVRGKKGWEKRICSALRREGLEKI